jgi:methyl-accepting chemotaxis protein
MFKNLNLEEKLRLKSRLNQTFLFLIAAVAIFGYYKVQIFNFDWHIMTILFAILGLLSAEITHNWINKIITNPIYKAVSHAGSATMEIAKETSQQETIVKSHIELLKETSGIIDKLKRSSQKTKESAIKVAEKSQESLDLSAKEQKAVKSNIEKMKTLKQKIEIIAELILELSEHTQQIGNIIGVVEDITEQTNMLALNAAVEAARAGEHGKGFAVVASEIRKLADESKQATTKITSLIYDIQQATNSTVMATEEGTKEIESGVDLAHQIAQSIDVLRNTINETVNAVDNIVKDSDNQLECTGEVSGSINKIDKGLLDSVKSIKQNLAIITELTEVSKNLKDNVLGNTDIISTEIYRQYKAS